MPAERVPMRSVREILRLRAEGLSDRAIARSTRLARSTVSDDAGRAVAAGLSWPLPEGLTDTALEARRSGGGRAAQARARLGWPASRAAPTGRHRLVPFGPRMSARLTAYLDLRMHRSGALMADAPLFSFTSGRAINPSTISQTFHALVPLILPAGVASPRVHDLRHSFAVGTLLRWYREGADPAARLLHLSTFLGHVDPTSTAVYLTITGDLLQLAGERFGRFAAPLSTGGAS